MKLITIKALPCVLMLAAAPASAFDINRLQAIGQSDFRLLSEDVGAALSYHPQTPTEPLGTTGFDIGILYAKVPGSDISFWGGEARWAFIQGGVAAPAVGVRGSYTKLSGVDQLDMSTKGLDISASKGFAFFTPYIGVGRTWITSEPHVANLTKEDFALNKFFIGTGFKVGLFNTNLEVDRTGHSTAYSLKLGVRF